MQELAAANASQPQNYSHCNWYLYRMMHRDLWKLTDEQAHTHFLQNEHKERRNCNFDWKAYLQANPDLRRLNLTTEKDALIHFALNGTFEMREFVYPPKFNWLWYLERNADIYYSSGLATRLHAATHYQYNGIPEGRYHAALTPTADSLEAALHHLHGYLNSSAMQERSTAHGRNLVIYNIDISPGCQDCWLTIGNLKMFLMSLLHHQMNAGEHPTFYWFNIWNQHDHILTDLIPTDLPNVVLVDWMEMTSSFNTFVQTLRVVGPDVFNAFGAVFHLSTGARGPFAYWHNGAWIGEFRRLLDARNVGLVGPMANCNKNDDSPDTISTPFVYLHAFALRPAVIPLIFEEEVSRTEFVPMEHYFHSGLSRLVLDNGFALASIIHTHYNAKGAEVMTSKSTGNSGSDATSRGDDNNGVFYITRDTTCPHLFGNNCSVDPEKALFLRWQLDPLVTPRNGYVCSKLEAMSEQEQVRIGLLTQMAHASLPADVAEKRHMFHGEELRWRTLLEPDAASTGSSSMFQIAINELSAEFEESFPYRVNASASLASTSSTSTSTSTGASIDIIAKKNKIESEQPGVCFVVHVSSLNLTPQHPAERLQRNKLRDLVQCKDRRLNLIYMFYFWLLLCLFWYIYIYDVIFPSLLPALLAQKNKNWIAYLYASSPRSVNKVNRAAESFADSRIRMLRLDYVEDGFYKVVKCLFRVTIMLSTKY
jgi:hypothetical protein